MLLVGLQQADSPPLMLRQQAHQLGPAGGQVWHGQHGGQLGPRQDSVLHNTGQQTELGHLLFVAQELGRIYQGGEEKRLLHQVTRKLEPVVEEIFPLRVTKSSLT